ncbi:MAG: sel1 repeat family protein [Xanthobacteraceae bacterium]|nr:sel1 repeat family protein [Xanthobacteraceae bacterium]
MKTSIRLAALLLAATAAISPARGAETSPAPALPDALIRYTTLDYVKALEMLLPLAQHGDPVAQEILGFMYMRGDGIPADATTAFNWFALAADAGRAEAQFQLGRIYRDGTDVPRDGKTALYWFGRAAQQGAPDAMNAAGEIYLGRDDVSADYAAALEWFFHAAEHGSAQAMFNIGTRYALGQGVARDEIEAFKWFELAAKEGIGGLRDNAATARINIATRLTPMQVQMASVRAQNWMKAHRANRIQ